MLGDDGGTHQRDGSLLGDAKIAALYSQLGDHMFGSSAGDVDPPSIFRPQAAACGHDLRLFHLWYLWKSRASAASCGQTYQDALAHYRRKLGLKAVSVNLGIVLDVGVMAGSTGHNFKVWEETLGMKEPAFLALMKSLINGQMGEMGRGVPCAGLRWFRHR